VARKQNDFGVRQDPLQEMCGCQTSSTGACDNDVCDGPHGRDGNEDKAKVIVTAALQKYSGSSSKGARGGGGQCIEHTCRLPEDED